MISLKHHNKGYGRIQLELLLKKAYELGINEALLTCDIDNIASARIMEKNGGKCLGEFGAIVNGKKRNIYIYLIPTT